MKNRSRRIRHNTAGHTLVVFREHQLFLERHKLNETHESMRLMMLRDQIDDLVGIMGEHKEAIGIVGQLLKDEHVGVGAIAADALKGAVAAGVDVSPAEGALKEAIGDKYAKKNAAGALALLYVKRGDVMALERLLKHSDKTVRDSAGEACSSESNEPRLPA